MVRPLGRVMVMGFSAILRFATGAPSTEKYHVAPEFDMAYSTACFSCVVLKIVPAFGSSRSSCCVTMESNAHFAHRLFGRNNGVTILFTCSGFSFFWETYWRGHIEYLDRFLVLCRGRSSFHATVIFTKISLADV